MIKEDDLMTGGSNFTKIIKDTIGQNQFPWPDQIKM